MTVRYIGSKARLVEAIMNIIGEPTNGSSHFVDAFCGTGVVSRTAALRGWSVSGNDTLLSATYLAEASLLSEEALDFSFFGSYQNTVEMLNTTPLVDGFIWRTYSPASGAISVRTTLEKLMASATKFPNGTKAALLAIKNRCSSLLI